MQALTVVEPAFIAVKRPVEESIVPTDWEKELGIIGFLIKALKLKLYGKIENKGIKNYGEEEIKEGAEGVCEGEL